MSWHHSIKLKHLFTEKEDHESVQVCMNAIADMLDADDTFLLFNTRPFRNVPQGDDVFGPIDYANRLLNDMYDYADMWRILIQ